MYIYMYTHMYTHPYTVFRCSGRLSGGNETRSILVKCQAKMGWLRTLRPNPNVRTYLNNQGPVLGVQGLGVRLSGESPMRDTWYMRQGTITIKAVKLLSPSGS